MLDLIMLVLFISGIFIGLRRGFILQFIHLTSFIIAFIVAKVYMNELAEKLILWIPYPSFTGDTPMEMIFSSGNLEDAYYRGIAFLIIFFIVKIVLQIVGSMLDFIAHLPILKQFNSLAGGVLGFLEVFLLAFIVLYFAALVPIESIQTALQDSVLAESIVKHTPILSQDIKELWIQ
ncbi:CvpA family protein [Bacillus sp. DNRA2]|uniref:CvpA family protein n=1 Tax=Bacillus sp. DNRA2 TaxID=2723053 RepID=UPI00145E30FE|nr:CvpA family protein [Bacillus sp. DNRA2]NMD70700.1 CvpA family protein [Bacillus sp. DNRA2]